MRIGIDLDGCVYDFHGTMRNYLHNHKGHPLHALPEPCHWSVWECWGISHSEWLQAFQEYEGIFTDGNPYPGALETLSALKKDHHSIHIVTARTNIGDEAKTIDWLTRHNVEFDELIFSENKCCTPTDVFIEDSVTNALSLKNAGVNVYLMRRRWNSKHYHSGVPYVDSWTEFHHQVRKHNE